MPIDPNVILGIKHAPIQQTDPLEQYGKSLTLQNLMRQGDAADRSEKRQSALQALLANNPDEEALRRGGFLDESLKVGKEARERAKIDAETGELKSKTAKTDQETKIASIQHTSSIMSTAKDQASWDIARRVLSVTFPGIEKNLPEQFDPQFVQAKIAEGQTITQKLTAEQAAAQQAETGRHNLASEGQTAATLAETARHNKFGEENPAMQHIETPDGIAAFNPRSGTAAPVMGADGKPLQGGKALTESQGKATGMALRAQTAHDILTNLEDAGTRTPGIIKQGAAGIPLVGGALAMGVNNLPTWAGGPNSEQNRVEQAQRDFVNAALRVESGASISESEFSNARKQYFPQPGDDAATIEQKRRNRETEIQSLKLQAGSGAKNVVAQKRPQMGGSDMAKAPVEVAKLSDADLLSALGIKR